uniref:60S acidic ribosomal protein P0 n=1 Tax=Lotus japonicus TaxID=34305 RepID=I3SAA6_LOTJA|nr:unknown [Lotus japonicus]
MGSLERKEEYLNKLKDLLDTYTKILLVRADNVGSNHMQSIRRTLRGKAVVLMGKNTMIRKGIRANLDAKPELEAIIPFLKGNVGLVFTNGDLAEVRKNVEGLRVSAAKAGAISPVEVIIPKGDTGLEPTQTAFLQALNIATKINKGQIQILDDKLLLTVGQKVGNSEAALLQKLKINPFSYGLTAFQVYEDGSIFEPSILDKTTESILKRFSEGIQNIASLSLAIGLPTLPAIPHLIAHAYRNVVAVALGTDYTFERVKDLKELLANPGALAAAAAAAAPAKEEKAPAKEEKKAPVKEESESEEEMGLDLFG